MLVVRVQLLVWLAFLLLACLGGTTLGTEDHGVALAQALFDNAQQGESGVLSRDSRAVGEDEDEDEDGPEGRHLKRKLKRKFKPHKYGGSLINGLLGAHHHGGFGGHHHGHGGGFGAGWPGVGGAGPVAIASAGSPGYQRPGYYRPPGGYGGFGGGPGFYNQRPSANVHTWNLGPLHGSIGFAQAGRR